MTNGAGSDVVTLTIDGKEITVPKGTLIIRAAEQLGIEIPRFCDHPLLEPVAACRQCYVKVEGQRKLMTSCSTPVADDMVVHSQFTDDEVREAQEAVLEFLLINHPLDCPVCDRGGECPLQDQALAYGPGESRYVEAKRTYRKPLPLSPLVNLDRERCVLCARCTRFCDQISGDRFIELFDRGAAEQVSIAPGEDFDSPFSGNTIQICPVGALTASTYRFVARPFDLKSADTICPHCACGCNMKVDLRRGEVVRHLARDNREVNDAWLCDKGRFAFAFADSPTRLTTPLLRDRGLEPVSFAEALGAIAGWCAGKRVGILAGGRLSDEDAFALSKLARVAFGTNDVDHRVGVVGNVPMEAEAAQAAGLPVTYADVERARAILVVGLDAEQELPILHLRIRRAVRSHGAKVVVVHPRITRLRDVGEHLLCRPGEEASVLARLAGESISSDEREDAAREALRDGGSGLVVLAGPRLADSPGAVAAAMRVAAGAGGSFALLARRANDRGALRAGLHPRLLPGGRRIEDGAPRSAVESAWGTLPPHPGRDARGILEAAAAREIDVLVLVGVDPLTDHPDAGLTRRALRNVPFKVVVDADAGAMATFADAMLPAAPYVEKDGHYTDWEGRSQRLRPVRAAKGLARSEWEIFQELSELMGNDLGFHSLDALHEEMAALYASPAAEVGAAPLGQSLPNAELRGASPGPLEALDVPPPAETSRDASAAEGSLILFTYPLLVDEGKLSRGADTLKEALAQPAFVEINAADAGRLGISDGSVVRLRTEGGEASLPARVSSDVAEGAVFVPWNQPGFAANTLLTGSLATPVTLESAGAEVTA
ncbi:MAG: NADH-quinone oxidoreductase subunit G [Actinomycetota bacterium]